MGTTIYQGFRLKTDSFAEAMRVIEGFRPWVNAQAGAMYDKFLGHLADEGVDAMAAHDRWSALRDLMRTKQQRVPQVDTDFSVSLVPVDGQLLGIVYTEQRSWFNAWLTQPGVEEFGYWSQSDAPDHVSDAEWAARRSAWAIVTNAPVCTQALSIDLVSPHGPVPRHWR